MYLPQEIFQKQYEFFQSGTSHSIEFRKSQLQKLKNLLITNHNDIVKALQDDMEKPEYETIASELMLVIDEINLFLKKLSSWTKSEKVTKSFTTMDGQGYTQAVPYGLSLIFSPWNYPLQLSLVPLVGALGAGNCCIIKPSEFTPKTSTLLAKIINGSFDPTYCYVADYNTNPQEWLDLPFDKIFFTGSPQVGKIVMAAAAKNLSSVTLELGGKSPAIFDELNAQQMEKSLKRLLWGKFLNNGQTCIAPDYLFIHQNNVELFKEILPKVHARFKAEKPLHRIINQRHYDRIKGYLNDGQVIYGGKYDDEKLSMELSILLPNSLDSSVMQDEIFGPILPVLVYSNLEETRNVINKVCEYPLACYIFSNNDNFSDYIRKYIRAGGFSINDTVSHILIHDLPFGGTRTSGLGNYHGKYSFIAFSHQQSFFKKSFAWELPFRYPPYVKGIKTLKSLYNKKCK